MNSYYVYILKCSDDSYYTGVTNDLKRRIEEHQSGKYDGYTLDKRPVTLVFSQEYGDINEAIKSEKQIKGWSRKKKEALINNDYNLLVKLSNHNKPENQ